MNADQLFNPTNKTQIKYSLQWAKYAAIVSFINLGLGILQMCIGLVKGNMIGTVFTFFLSSLITLIMSASLFRFAKLATISLEASDSIQFEKALSYLKMYFKVMGILFLIIIGLLALFVLIALLVNIADYAGF
ncbi:MAG: hypothetical protein IPI46_06050 [Bacteroidetes bacterium]|nr:hypothetical protein [Bacteroidota bacterium]